jgi:aminocarboxymuconate-semialdehyde decarboxylase
MRRYHLRNLIGNPAETALGAAHLIFGGVLDRHPGLVVLLAHGGGALPWVLGRLDRGFDVRPECRGSAAAPSRQARRFLYDTVVFSPQVLRALVEWVGPARVVLGTDAPFDMSDPHPVTTVAQALGDADARHAVLAGNAARLLASVRAAGAPAPPAPSACSDTPWRTTEGGHDGSRRTTG